MAVKEKIRKAVGNENADLIPEWKKASIIEMEVISLEKYCDCCPKTLEQ